MSSEEKRIEHHESKTLDHLQVGKPVTTPEENARLERHQKLELAKVHRLTKDPSNQFQLIDNSKDKPQQVVHDFRGFAPEKLDTSKEPSPGKFDAPSVKKETKISPDGVQSSVDAPLPPNRPKLELPILPGGIPLFDFPSGVPTQSALILPEDLRLFPEPAAQGLPESLPKKWEPASTEKLSPEALHDLIERFKHHDGEPTQIVDGNYAQERQIGGKLFFELPNDVQFVQQSDRTTIHDRKHGDDILSYVQNNSASPEKIKNDRENSDTTNSAVTHTERTWNNRPETVAHQLAGEILHGDFEAFNRDRNVGKYHYTQQELERLRQTFQESIAQAQFNIRHLINYTEAEANIVFHNIDYAVKYGLIDKAECDGIKKKYLQKEQAYAQER